MKLYLIIAIVLFMPIAVSAQIENDYNGYSFVDMNFQIVGEFSLAGSNSINSINADLSFFPAEELNQEILNINMYSSPYSEITKKEDNINYYWQKPNPGEFLFNLDSNVKVRNALVLVDSKISFPIGSQDTPYNKPGEFIDINKDISKQAQSIVAGEDDLYVATFKVANWIQENIEYNLSTLTADIVQKSSWVLENREGVCDEITNLFISMMRSLGVPARFVSGMAYTNTKGAWGPHAWAEVYFPNKGWVPFDVTYGQLGWLDPTHIKMKTSIDSGEPAVKYSWRASNADFNTQKLDIRTSLVEKGSRISRELDMKVKLLTDKVGPGSYVPFEVEIKNNNAHYFPSLLIIKKTPELISKNFRSILLKPWESKKEFWIIKIPDELDKNFVYYSAIEVEDSFHYNTNTTLEYSANGNVISLEEAKKLIDENTNKEERKTSYGVKLECSSPEAIYTYQNLDIGCVVSNSGDTVLINTNVCVENKCEELPVIGINEKKEVNFTLNNLEKGTKTLAIDASNTDLQREISITDLVTVNIVEGPDLEIVSISYNPKPDYDDSVKIEATLNLKLAVKDVEVFINDVKVMEAEELNKARKIIVVAKASDFAARNIEVKIKYKDLNNKDYVKLETYSIDVQGIPFWARVLKFLGLT